MILFPPLIMGALDRLGPFKKLVQRMPRVRPVAEIAVLTGLLAVVLPMAIAVYPQEVRAPVEQLEPEFQNLRDDRGQRVTHLSYNKGL